MPVRTQKKMQQRKPVPTDYAFWKQEIDAAKEARKTFVKQGESVVEKFLDERPDGSTSDEDTKWNLFWSGITLLQSHLYGQTPKVDVARRFADPKDDVARVAGEMMERLLNTDLEDDGDGFCSGLEDSLEDRLLPGLGQVRVRYEFETEDRLPEGVEEEMPAKLDPRTGEEIAPAVGPVPTVVNEEVAIDYLSWRDWLWSAGARRWVEVRWVGFRVLMTRAELIKKFGEELGRAIPLDVKKSKHSTDRDATKDDPRSRAAIYEIWDKTKREVVWLSEAYPAVLLREEDPLELKGFFPCPRPMVANKTTSRFMPKPDYTFAQDLYRNINEKMSRIASLVEAVRMTGFYDGAEKSIMEKLFERTRDNRVYPVQTWGRFVDKGGITGAVQFMPLEHLMAAIAGLRNELREDVDALWQVTGMSDILRGQVAGPDVTATDARGAMKFGSVRIKRLQDDFSRFATEIQSLKAEIVVKHFQPATIVERSNMEMSEGAADAEVLGKAVQLIKSGRLMFRVQVKSESLSMMDFSELRTERSEIMQTLAQFLTAAFPMMEKLPESTPYLLELLQWLVAGQRGSASIEGVIDEAIRASREASEAAKQAQAAGGGQQQMDPRVMATQMKGAQDLQKEQFKLQADLTRIEAEKQADAEREHTQAVENTREAAMKAQVQAQARAARGVPPTGGGNQGPGQL